MGDVQHHVEVGGLGVGLARLASMPPHTPTLLLISVFSTELVKLAGRQP